MRDHFSFDIRHERFTAQSRFQPFDVVGGEAVKKTDSIGTSHFDLRSVTDVKEGDTRRGRSAGFEKIFK